MTNIYSVQFSPHFKEYNQKPQYYVSFSQLMNILSTRCSADSPMLIVQHNSYTFKEEAMDLLVYLPDNGLYYAIYKKRENILIMEHHPYEVSTENLNAHFEVLGLWKGELD